MFPYFYTTNNIEYPLSGDVTQGISAAFIGTMKGLPDFERKVVTDVASYGDQLGTLTDAVLQLAERQGVTGDKITRLEETAKKIEDMKADYKSELRNRAVLALRKLEAADEGLYQDVLDEEAAKT